MQAVLQDRQDEAERHLWIERGIHAINAAFPNAEYRTWEQYERLLPLALVAAQKIEREQIVTEETGRLLYEMASYLLDRARYAEAEPLYRRALYMWERLLGPDHLEVTYPLNGLARLYNDQGEYAGAESLYQRALRIREQQLGPEHPETAETIHDLAQFRETQGKSEEARVWYVRALTVREQALGMHHPKTIETRAYLIALLHTMGQHKEATQLELTQSKS